MSLPSDRIEVAAAAIVREVGAELQLLSARRSEPAFAEHGWEFPGGKLRLGESAEAALHRELAEELSVSVRLLTRFAGDLPNQAWAISDQIAMHLFVCQLAPVAEPVLTEAHIEWAWLPLAEVESVRWLPADLPLLRDLVAWLPSTLRG